MNITEKQPLRMKVFDTKENTNITYQTLKDSVAEAVEFYVIGMEKKVDSNPNIIYMRQTYYNVVEIKWKNGSISYKVFSPII